MSVVDRFSPSRDLASHCLSGRRLLISEEALKDEVGHWFEYCRAVQDIHTSRDVHVVTLAHVDVTAPVREALNSVPLFRETSWDGLHVEPNFIKRYWAVITHNWLVFRSVDRFLREQGPFDLAFAPTVTIHHLIGWRLVAALHAGRRIGRIVLLFRNNAGYYVEFDDRPRFRKLSRILGALIMSFKSAIASKRVLLATDSERLADEYEALSSVRPVVFPSPRVGPRPGGGARERRNAEERILRFSCLGPARFEKGIDILQEAIKLLLMRRVDSGEGDEIHFTIQWNMAILDGSGRAYLPDPSLVADRRVEFLDAPLDTEAYTRELQRADCMILPYRRDSYFARISGVAVEAVTTGIPVIFTKGTWCATLVETSGAGLGIPDGDAPALADAIAEVAKSYHRYRAEALEKADLARTANSAENFICNLWGGAPARNGSA